MSVVYILVPLAVAILAVALLAFRWAARRGQFDDLDTPAMRMLHDDEGEAKKPEDASRGPRRED